MPDLGPRKRTRGHVIGPASDFSGRNFRILRAWQQVRYVLHRALSALPLGPSAIALELV